MKWHWSEDELAAQWSLTAKELALLPSRSDHGRLGCAILLKYFQCQGYFPGHRKDIPDEVVTYVARVTGTAGQSLEDYDWEGRTGRRHRQKIRAFLGLRHPSPDDLRHLCTWLFDDILPFDCSIEQMREFALAWFAKEALEPIAAEPLERLLRSTGHAFETKLCQRIAELLTPEAKVLIDVHLIAEDNELGADPSTRAPAAEAKRTLDLIQLKADPGRISLDSVLQELAKLARIRQLALPATAFAALPGKWLQKYRRRTSTESSWELRRHPAETRYALVAAFCWERQQEITDAIIDLLVQVIHKIGTRAENQVEETLLEDLRRVRGKTQVLFRLAEAAVDQPDGGVKEVLYPVVGLETLQELVKEFKVSGPAYQRVVHTVIRTSYSHHYRRLLPPLLDALEFRSNNTLHRPVMEALQLLKAYRDSRQPYFATEDSVPIEGVVKNKWRDLVIAKDKDGKERINRINYEIAVLQALRDRLRSKEIWVVGANRYRNPDEDLPGDFERNRAAYYEALDQPPAAHTFIANMKTAMVDGLMRLNQGMPENPSVKIRDRGKHRLCITPLEAQPEPENLKHLKDEIFRRWSSTDLLDILKEADLRVGFTDLFHSSRQRETLDRVTRQRRLLLCLYGLGTNTGLKRIVVGSPGTSYQELL